MALIQMQATSDGGPIVQRVQYNATTGRWHRIERTQQSDGGWDNERHELREGFKMAVDFGNVKVGWINFNTGGAPSYVLVTQGENFPQKPDNAHKQGAQLLVHLSKDGGLRQLSFNSQSVNVAFNELHDAYLSAPEAASGKIPVVQFDGTEERITKGKDANGKPVSSTNYKPIFKIVQWIDRLPEFGERTVPPPGGHAATSGGNGAARPAAPQTTTPARPVAAAPQRSSVQQRVAQLPQEPVGMSDQDIEDDIPF